VTGELADEGRVGAGVREVRQNVCRSTTILAILGAERPGRAGAR